MLLGRRTEQTAVDRLLGEARKGRSGGLVVTGDPGIGKSALLAYAAERAEGMTVLSVRGFESESEIPFAGLSELFHPVLHLLDVLPDPQAAAMSGALSLGPPVQGDRFSVCAATVGLLAAAAEEAPLLSLVDDVHWLDSSSRQAILFAARRLHAEGIAVMLGSRETGHAAEYAGIRELRLAPLPAGEADKLLSELSPEASADVRARIYDLAGGNPLAMREMSDRWPHGEEMLPGPGLPPESRLVRALGGRLAELPAATHDALMLAAASPGSDKDLVLRAARAAGLTLADFAPAEEAGLLGIEDRRILFRHPLLRSILYGQGTAHARARAHDALARTLEEVPGDDAADARAWHLAAARIPPDEETRVLLVEAGRRARRRGGHGEAARAFEVAARFSPPAERAVLLLRAARGWQLAGRSGRMLPLLEEALPLTDDVHLRGMIQHMDAYVRVWRERPVDGLDRLVTAAAGLEAADPERAALMEADANIACFMLGRVRQGVRLLEHADELSERGSAPATRLVVSVALVTGLTVQGRRPEAKARLARVAAELDACDPLSRAQELAHAAFASLWLEEYGQAERWLDRVVARARDLGALGVLPQTLGMRADLYFRTGRWPASRAAAQESVTLGTQIRQADVYSRYFLARLDGLQGREAQCHEGIERVRDAARRYGATVLDAYTEHLLGHLALARGDLGTAVRHLENVRDLPLTAQLADQSVVPWAFDLAEAYARSNRPAEALELLGEHTPEAGDPDHRWAHAAAARCRGLLAAPRDLQQVFEEALLLHEADGQPYERARTLLCHGERLRRHRQRGAARKQLRAALEVFDRLGALPWAQRAETELLATGETLDRGTGVVALLTPQELQVATVVAGGASNAEAAAALFLSPKTIEYHLSNTYRKTGVGSRDGLATLLGGAG